MSEKAGASLSGPPPYSEQDQFLPAPPNPPNINQNNPIQTAENPSQYPWFQPQLGPAPFPGYAVQGRFPGVCEQPLQPVDGAYPMHSGFATNAQFNQGSMTPGFVNNVQFHQGNTPHNGGWVNCPPGNMSMREGIPVNMHGTAMAHPRDFLGQAIFVTLCCFWPTGIIAIIKASDARTSADRGDLVTAHSYARAAKQMINVSIGVGLLSVVMITAIIGIYLGLLMA